MVSNKVSRAAFLQDALFFQISEMQQSASSYFTSLFSGSASFGGVE
jgi:hypothetical protein